MHLKKLLSLTLFFFIIINIHAQDFELIPYRKDTKWGFADSTGKVKIEPAYQSVLPFNRGYSAFKQKGKWGFIDIKGKEVLEAQYDSVGPYFRGFYSTHQQTNESIIITALLIFKEKQKSFVDVNGKNAFDKKDPDYLSIVDDDENTSEYKNKIELYKKGSKYGFKIKKSGFVATPEYDSLIYSDTDSRSIYGDTPSAYFLAKKKGKWGIISTENNEKLPFNYDQLVELSFDGNKLFKKDGKWGVMNAKYSSILKNNFDSLTYKYGNYIAKIENKWGVLDYKLDIIIPFIYNELNMNSDQGGFYVKNENNKWGYINDEGQLQIPVQYAYLKKLGYTNSFKYKNNLNGKTFGLVTIDQAIQIKDVYDNVFPFKNGYALVIKDGQQGYINEKGYEFFE